MVLNKFKAAVIKERIRFCEIERRDLLRMVTTSQVDLAWISERMNCVQTELRFLYRDLKAQERMESEEEN